MKHRMILAACAALVVATPAAAEPLRPAQVMEPGTVPPYEVLTIVRSAGFDPLGQPFRRGRNYVLRAIGGDDQVVRVVVNAHRGDIVRVVPIASASAMPPPRGGVAMGPYERMEPAPGYLPPRTAYRGGPPVIDEDDEPVMENDPRIPRPPGAVPGGSMAPGAPPPRVGYASPPPPPPRGGGDIQRSDLPPPSGPRVITASPPPSGPRVVTASPPPPGEPHVITATEPGRNGMLPPPPERFPQRAVAPVKPKPPVKRDIASIPKQPQPRTAPLPKPRPPHETTATAAPAAKPAPAPQPVAEPPAAAAAPSKTEATPAAPAATGETPHDASKALPN